MEDEGEKEWELREEFFWKESEGETADRVDKLV